MDTQKRFEIFKEKTEELLNSNFIKELSADSGFSMSATIGKSVQSKRSGPSYESIKNFVITFRAFILDSDGISIHELSKIYSILEENNDLRVRFEDTRIKFNTFLDSAW